MNIVYNVACLFMWKSFWQTEMSNNRISQIESDQEWNRNQIK